MAVAASPLLRPTAPAAHPLERVVHLLVVRGAVEGGGHHLKRVWGSGRCGRMRLVASGQPACAVHECDAQAPGWPAAAGCTDLVTAVVYWWRLAGSCSAGRAHLCKQHLEQIGCHEECEASQQLQGGVRVRFGVSSRNGRARAGDAPISCMSHCHLPFIPSCHNPHGPLRQSGRQA